MDREAAALPKRALHGDLSAVALCYPLGDRQSKAGALHLVVAIRNPIELFEQTGLVLRRNAPPGVPNFHQNFPSLRVQADYDLSALGVVFDGVSQQVEQQLFEQFAVPVNRRQ